jgi:hypothetical protein
MAGTTGSLQILTGMSMVLENTTSENVTKHSGVVVRETSRIATWTATNDNTNEEVDLVAKFDIAATDLLVTDPALLIPDGLTSSSITLTSGSVWLLTT